MWEIQKADQRKRMRQLLKAMPEEEKRKLDHEIAVRVRKLLEIRTAEAVFAYASLPWEAGTGEILSALWEKEQSVYLPRVSGDTMDFFRVSSEADLKEGSLHIMEPAPGCRKADEKDLPAGRTLMLVPGMCFTESGLRLGKGGGYYDRYLEEHGGHKTIALAYEFQLVTDLPAEPHDKRVDMIVTEKRVIDCRSHG